MKPGDTLTLIDLGGVFVLKPQRSDIDVLVDEIAAKWQEDGETLESMLRALNREREKRSS